MPTAHRITERQQQVVDFVRDYTAEKGYAPTFGEIGAWMGISREGAAGHVRRLVEAGVLLWEPSIHRSVKVGE